MQYHQDQPSVTMRSRSRTLEILRLSRLSGKAQLRELRWPATALIFLF